MNPDSTSNPNLSLTPKGIANPYPFYRRYRERSPVRLVRIPAGVMGRKDDVWSFAMLKHEHVTAVLRDPETYSSKSWQVVSAVPRISVFHDDPPRHTQLRRLLTKAFTPRRIAELEPWIRELTVELIDAMKQGEKEFMASFAIPLPMRVIASMMGLPPEDYATFRYWSEATVGYAGMPHEDRVKRMQEMFAYFVRTIAARRREPKDGLIDAMIAAEVDGVSLDDTEVMGFCTLLLIAGNETTTNLLGNMMGILADRPELWERARKDRSLVEPIVNETLRYESPVQRLFRSTTREVQLGDVTIPKGHLVDVCYGAANRDPAVYSDPEEFRPERPEREHLAFGAGIHYCIGAPLARLEATVALNHLLDRYETIGRGAIPARRQGQAPMGFGYERLPLVFGKG